MNSNPDPISFSARRELDKLGPIVEETINEFGLDAEDVEANFDALKENSKAGRAR